MSSGAGKPAAMAGREEVVNLEGLLGTVEKAGDGADTVGIGMIRDRLGGRSFGPLLLFPALVPLTPVSTVPGVPGLVGITTIVVAGQMLIGARGVWIPRVLLRRTVRRRTVERAIAWMRPVARMVDRVVRPRLTVLTRPPSTYAVALCCVLLGILMLPLALVPFTSGIPAFPVVLFGLALATRDGLLVVAGFLSVVAAGLVFLVFGGAVIGALPL
jgi:hypothetical protein